MGTFWGNIMGNRMCTLPAYIERITHQIAVHYQGNGCNSLCFVSSVNVVLKYAWISAVFFTVGTECLQVWYQEFCQFALVVLYSLERMKSPQSTYRHGRIYPVTAIISKAPTLEARHRNVDYTCCICHEEGHNGYCSL